MVRGRRKCASSKNKLDVGNTGDEGSGIPKKKDSKLTKEFKGKLSHSSPRVHDVEITQFFHPTRQIDTVPSSNDFLSIANSAASLEADSSSRQQESSSNLNENGENENQSNTSTPRKAHFIKDETLSPSSAFSHLRISLTPKKASKSRRRLNPSQTVNQQPRALPIPGGISSKSLHSACLKGYKPPVTLPAEGGNHKLTEYFPIRRSERKTKKTVLEERQQAIEQAVLSEKEDGLEVHNFEGKGRGIVTTRDFCKGEFVVEYAGELIDMSEAKIREMLYAQDQNTGCYMYYFKYRNTQYCIDATAESGRLGRLVNHSRNGNLLTKTVCILNKPHLVLLAKEDIPAGDEIMYDYGDRSKESIRYHPWLTM